MATIWSSGIGALARPIERVTGPYARALIEKAGMRDAASQSPLTVFDNACGTGVVTMELLKMLNPEARQGMKILCGDNSDAMLEFLRQRVETEGWKEVEVKFVDAMKTGLPSNHFTHVITNFAIMLVPDPGAALDECFRMLKTNGTCAFSTWAAVGWMKDAQAALDRIPNAPPVPDFKSFLASFAPGAWDETDYIEEQMRKHGFVDIQVEAVPKTLDVGKAADSSGILVPIMNHIMRKFWTEEEREQMGHRVQGAVSEQMMDKYGEEKSIHMDWVAILVTARKPE